MLVEVISLEPLPFSADITGREEDGTKMRVSLGRSSSIIHGRAGAIDIFFVAAYVLVIIFIFFEIILFRWRGVSEGLSALLRRSFGRRRQATANNGEVEYNTINFRQATASNTDAQ